MIAIIPARGGSKSIQGKNVVPIAGKPLIAYSILQAQLVNAISRVLVSTDDDEIASVSRQYGAEVIQRPQAISGDTASSESALLHALDMVSNNGKNDPALVLFMQCTSPVRRDGDITDAISLFEQEKADSLLSVYRFHTFMWKRDTSGAGYAIDYDFHHRPRRQDREPEFIENGSFYLFRPQVLRMNQNRLGGKVILYEMDQFSQIDINEPEDVPICESIVAHLRGKPGYARSLGQ